MADDKRGRESQARDERDRQRERALELDLDHMDDPTALVDEATLDEVETSLETVSFPTTGAEVVAAVGEAPLDPESHIVADVIPDTDAETFESAEQVRRRLERPDVAAAMKRIVEAAASLENAGPWGSQRDAYFRTLREVAALDDTHEESALTDVADWTVAEIEESRKLPGSRAVRRQAAKICRANGHEIRTDEWLGV